MKRKLLQMCGALLLTEVAKLLGMSPEAVNGLRRDGRFIAVTDRDEFVYPSVQFAGRVPIHSLSHLLGDRIPIVGGACFPRGRIGRT